MTATTASQLPLLEQEPGLPQHSLQALHQTPGEKEGAVSLKIPDQVKSWGEGATMSTLTPPSNSYSGGSPCVPSLPHSACFL